MEQKNNLQEFIYRELHCDSCRTGIIHKLTEKGDEQKRECLVCGKKVTDIVLSKRLKIEKEWWNNYNGRKNKRSGKGYTKANGSEHTK